MSRSRLSQSSSLVLIPRLRSWSLQQKHQFLRPRADQHVVPAALDPAGSAVIARHSVAQRREPLDRQVVLLKSVRLERFDHHRNDRKTRLSQAQFVDLTALLSNPLRALVNGQRGGRFQPADVEVQAEGQRRFLSRGGHCFVVKRIRSRPSIDACFGSTSKLHSRRGRRDDANECKRFVQSSTFGQACNNRRLFVNREGFPETLLRESAPATRNSPRGSVIDLTYVESRQS